MTRVITATITLLYISYSIPVICLLFRGRSNIPHGPHWFGTAGLVANWVLLIWTLFSVVIFAFPANMPAEAGSELPRNSAETDGLTSLAMNYISAVYAIIAIIVAADWFLRARTSYHGQLRDRVDVVVGNGVTTSN